MVGIRTILSNEDIRSTFFYIFRILGLSMTKPIINTWPCFHLESTPSKRPKRRVESYRIYKRTYSACSQSPEHPLRVTEKANHGNLVGPTLSTPRGDKYYN